MKWKKEKQVYILYRWFIIVDDGPEMYETKVYTTFEKAESAAAEWFGYIESTLRDNGIEYEWDPENWSIGNSTGRWGARVQKSVLR